VRRCKCPVGPSQAALPAPRRPREQAAVDTCVWAADRKILSEIGIVKASCCAVLLCVPSAEAQCARAWPRVGVPVGLRWAAFAFAPRACPTAAEPKHRECAQSLRSGFMLQWFLT
jgi:hypothetical protein